MRFSRRERGAGTSKAYVWRITEIRKTGSYLGSVEAATADEAIKLAELPPDRAKRLVAQQER
jgi:hypothetical protein